MEIKNKLKATTIGGLSAIAGIMMFTYGAPSKSQSAPANKCEFFEHFDYEGRSFMLHHNHVLTVGTDVQVKHEDARRTRGDYQKFVDPTWKGIISSVKTGSNCVAQMNFPGGNGINVQKDAPRMSGQFNDSAEYVSCYCKN